MAAPFRLNINPPLSLLQQTQDVFTMEEVDVPPFFLCPISLQIMKDPVTLSTGITYDRETIEKWLFSQKNTTCPVTKQLLSHSDLTPNHTLRRLIQGWCTLNTSNGVERIPTPKPPIETNQIVKLLQVAKKSPNSQQNCLRRLRSLASENETNKRCMEAAGAVEFLAAVVCSSVDVESNSDYAFDNANPGAEALSILHKLQISEGGLKYLLGNDNRFVRSLTKILQTWSYGSRGYAVMLLKSMFEVADQTHIISVNTEFFVEIVQLQKDQISPKATKAALNVLISVCRPSSRNRVKAVEAGGVGVLIELLLDLDSSEKRACEMILVIVDLLCGCAEGRAEVVNHGAGLAVVSKKIHRVSSLGSERCVGILYSIAKFSASPSVVQEMLQMGVVTKLCLFLQVVGSGNKPKERAREILKLHSRAWKNSSCLPINLRSYYPS